jgi:hypothetical protein
MMFLTKKFNLGLTLMLFFILLSACGPSPEELAATSAAETVAAATSTPTITPTPKPTNTPTPPPEPFGLIAYIVINDFVNPDVDGIHLLDPQDPDSTILISSYPQGDFFPAWSPDGQFIAITSMHYVFRSIANGWFSHLFGMETQNFTWRTRMGATSSA